jgi:hypothetical protein
VEVAGALTTAALESGSALLAIVDTAVEPACPRIEDRELMAEPTATLPAIVAGPTRSRARVTEPVNARVVAAVGVSVARLTLLLACTADAADAVVVTALVKTRALATFRRAASLAAPSAITDVAATVEIPEADVVDGLALRLAAQPR